MKLDRISNSVISNLSWSSPNNKFILRWFLYKLENVPIGEVEDHPREMRDPTTPAIRAVGSPSTAEITNCTAIPAISQHFWTLPLLLLRWWCSSVFFKAKLLRSVLLSFCPLYNSRQFSTNISLTHATWRLYFLQDDLYLVDY